MLHLDPQEIEAHARCVCGDVNTVHSNCGSQHSLTRLQFFLDGVTPFFLTHFLINQISATSQPRPLPPCPGSRVRARCNSPLLVASRGRSNSTGRYGTAFSMKGWISISPFATNRIFCRGLSPA